MFGTGYELLYYFSFDNNARLKIGILPQQAVNFRKHVVAHWYCEERITEWLTTLGCTQIRPQVIVPAVLRSKKGKLYTERTVLAVLKPEDYTRYDIVQIRNRLRRKKTNMPDEKFIRHVCRHGHFTKIIDRVVMPSVWEYCPVMYSGARPDSVARLIGY